MRDQEYFFFFSYFFAYSVEIERLVGLAGVNLSSLALPLCRISRTYATKGYTCTSTSASVLASADRKRKKNTSLPFLFFSLLSDPAYRRCSYLRGTGTITPEQKKNTNMTSLCQKSCRGVSVVYRCHATLQNSQDITTQS